MIRYFKFFCLRPNILPLTKSLHTTTTIKMPLVVPGVTSGDAENSKTQQWMNALMGKQIGQKEDANVGSFYVVMNVFADTIQTFDKSKLPEKHRIIKPGQMVTKDFDQDR